MLLRKYGGSLIWLLACNVCIAASSIAFWNINRLYADIREANRATAQVDAVVISHKPPVFYNRSGSVVMFSMDVYFSYVVHDEHYGSSSVRPGTFIRRSTYRREFNELGPGDTIQIWYNPDRPHQAWIYKEPEVLYKVFVFVWAFLPLLLGIVVGLASLHTMLHNPFLPPEDADDMNMGKSMPDKKGSA